MDGIECLWADCQAHRFPRHIHDTFTIGLVHSGVNGFYCRGQMRQAAVGAVCAVNPGEVHTGGEAGRWSYWNLYPSGEQLQALAGQIGRRRGPVPFFRNPVIHDPRSAHLLRAMLVSLTQGMQRVECESLLLQALSHLVLHHADEPTPVTTSRTAAVAVRCVREFLDAHYCENVSLAQLADVAQMSPYHLLRIFRRTVGLPPHAYLMQRRLQKARTLLLNGVTPAQAATDSGFADQAHLTRRFKAFFGLTPGRMRA